MNRIERAVIMAAGRGTRLMPLTGNLPKPLISVNGIRLIESALKSLNDNGIFEIVIVVGHLADAFDYLPTKYPGVRLIHNPYYGNTNNISSLYAARDHLRSALIMDGDQLIHNSSIFRRDFKLSGYLAVRNNGPTHEWTLDVKEGRIVGCTRGGGSGGLRLLSASLWSDEAGTRLAEDISFEFSVRGRTDIYWDDVPLFIHPEHFELGVREVSPADLTEIDTLEELVAIDSSYRKYLLGVDDEKQ